MYRRYFGPSDQQPLVVVSQTWQFLGSLGWYCRIVSRLLLLYDEDVGGAVAAQLEVTNCDLKSWSSALVWNGPEGSAIFRQDRL